jgi:hypothetical protein
MTSLLEKPSDKIDDGGFLSEGIPAVRAAQEVTIL